MVENENNMIKEENVSAEVELTIAILICFLWRVFETLFPHSEFVIVFFVFFVFAFRRKVIIPDCRVSLVVIIIHTLLCLLTDTLSIRGFAVQMGSVVLSYLYYYNIVYYYKPYRVIHMYCRIAIVFAVVALLQEVCGLWNPDIVRKICNPLCGTIVNYGPLSLVRIDGLAGEAYLFTVVMMPAVYCALRRILLRDDRIYSLWVALLILISFILSFSTTGYVCFLIALLFVIGEAVSHYKMRTLLFERKIVLMFMMIIGVVVSALIIMINSSTFSERISDTWEVAMGSKSVESSNLSTYALASNYIVAKNMLIETNGLGVGFGSYGKNYWIYSRGLDTSIHVYGINSEDGANVVFRLMGEMGVIGIFFLVYVLFYCRHSVVKEYKWINNAAFIAIILRILRLGNYTFMGWGLILAMCLFTKKNHQREQVRALKLESSF